MTETATATTTATVASAAAPDDSPSQLDPLQFAAFMIALGLVVLAVVYHAMKGGSRA